MRSSFRTAVVTLLTATALAGCGGNAAAPDDWAVAEKIVAALQAACPMAAPSDEDARALCSANLSADKYLSSVMKNPIMWGGQKAGTSYHPEESNMNYFNTFVWRRMYLSLMMFSGEPTIEQTADGLTVVHMPLQFRNDLEIGSYPYPFWHSQNKWNAYQLAREFVMVIQNGKWFGAMRSVDQDTTRAKVPHTWSGQWQWSDGGTRDAVRLAVLVPVVEEQPNVARLDAAYRALSDGLRAQSCMQCHAPDNHAAITPLEFFNFPNQALTARDSIIARLQLNDMPPAANDLGFEPRDRERHGPARAGRPGTRIQGGGRRGPEVRGRRTDSSRSRPDQGGDHARAFDGSLAGSRCASGRGFIGRV